MRLHTQCALFRNQCSPRPQVWPVSTWLRIEAEDVAILGVAWPLPFGLTSGPLKTLNTSGCDRDNYMGVVGCL